MSVNRKKKSMESRTIPTLQNVVFFLSATSMRKFSGSGDEVTVASVKPDAAAARSSSDLAVSLNVCRTVRLADG